MLFLENCLKNYYNKMLWEVKISSHLPKNNFLILSTHLFLQKTKRFHKSLTTNSPAWYNYPHIPHYLPTKKSNIRIKGKKDTTFNVTSIKLSLIY